MLLTMQPLHDKHQLINPSVLRVIIAGGGTGGHLFPGIAIAKEFMARNPNNAILFVGTGKPLETSVLSQSGFKFEKITAEGIKNRGWVKQILSLAKIPKGMIESVRILKHFRPDLVIGVGGYSAGPLVMGAWLLGVPIALHEQNLLPGITNRVLARFADRVFVSFDNTRLKIDVQKIRVTGNPVRAEMLTSNQRQKSITVEDTSTDRPFTVLILGGSQGAHGLNLKVVDALKLLKEKGSFFFIHQTGPQDESMVNEAYQRHGIVARVQSFFNDMAQQYQAADLVICRAGATTVAEITAIGKGALFVPFPYAADDHQVLNAMSLVNAGAAEMIQQQELSAEILADRIAFYAFNPQALRQMASRAGCLGRPQAAAAIVDECYRLASDATKNRLNFN